MPARHAPFGPEWLQGKLATLLPDLPRAHLCVALSGGVDSSVLLAALAEGKQTRRNLRAIHIEHGLHPDAPRWSAHCSALAKKLGVPLEVHRIRVTHTRGTSLEESARRARYALLESLLRRDEVLLTAHHADDQLETVLLQLLRGAGLPGLAAMADIAPFGPGWLARPLLSRTRAEIETWARAHDLEWVEDETNADERFDRNYLRRRVLPLLRERWPGAAAAVSRSARHAAEAQRLLEALARADVEAASDGPALSV
ncbi:MAG TPA: tRNA lysidine(34) synthetase TilS, partial [Steroidobacteraceae bacterium]